MPLICCNTTATSLYLFYQHMTNPDNPNQIFPVGDGFGLFVYFEKFEDTHFRNGVVKRPESKPRGPRKPKKIKLEGTI